MNETTMILRDENGEYSVTVRESGLPLSALVEKVIEPLLLATGYPQAVIDQYFAGGDE